MGNFIGLAGIAVILGIAVLFSSNRKAIQLRIVGAAFALQVLIATLVLYWSCIGTEADRASRSRAKVSWP
jgi:nucleoside permease NupC